MKKILVTAGSTSVPIDSVRVISNVFRGRTGHIIAEAAAAAGHEVTLLTSGASEEFAQAMPGLRMHRFRTFDELHALMEREIQSGAYDAIIHSAAVSDYRVASIRSIDPDSMDVPAQELTTAETGAKIGSNHPYLQLTLVPTEKLIDKVRSPWNFTGTLVKFKLQVDMSDTGLLQIARRSMEASSADLIVANCLEWAQERAYILDRLGGCNSIARAELPAALLRRLV